jgi:hypothetical protein
MKNDKALQNEVFAHILMNPPAEFRSSTVDITIENSKELVLAKKADNSETQYDLCIPNPMRLGLPSSGQAVVNNFLADVVLAFNLNLNVSALTMSGRNVSRYRWIDKPGEHQQAESPESENVTAVFHSEDGPHVISNVIAKIHVESRVHVQMVTSESIEENELITTLNLLNKVDRHKALTNLGKALDSYEAAMSEINPLFIFKHLYNSLELAVNSDGTDRKRTPLAVEIELLTQVPRKDVLVWHDFYNRTKHIDKNSTEAAMYNRLLRQLPLTSDQLRATATNVVIQKLK